MFPELGRREATSPVETPLPLPEGGSREPLPLLRSGPVASGPLRQPQIAPGVSEEACSQMSQQKFKLPPFPSISPGRGISVRKEGRGTFRSHAPWLCDEDGSQIQFWGLDREKHLLPLPNF